MLGRETLGASLGLVGADTLQIGKAGGAGVYAGRQASARILATGAAAPGNGVDGAGGGVTLAVSAVAVSALLTAPGLKLRVTVEAAGSGLAAVNVPFLLVQVVELPLESVHVDGVSPRQESPDFGPPLADFLLALLKHWFFLLLVVGGIGTGAS